MVSSQHTLLQHVFAATGHVQLRFILLNMLLFLRRARYVAYRQAGYLTPFSVRKTPYKQKIFSMGTHIIKEYTGCRETVGAAGAIGLCVAAAGARVVLSSVFRGVLGLCLYVNNSDAVLAVPSSIASSLMLPYQQFDAAWQQSGWDVRQGHRLHVASLGPIRARCSAVSRRLRACTGCSGLQVEKELAILQQLHHPHLVSFMFIADQGSRISIIMDWAGENLREHRTVTQSQQYTEDVARYMMYQLTSALVYLHSKVGQCMQFRSGTLYVASHAVASDCSTLLVPHPA